ncbi:AAA family ATPase [Tahibacter amnicola]|uniref:AAA family ATPase n=1 Tax=Tahibacter amnicola TaxID=2976241 RepID=UPI003CCCE7C7
MGQASACDGTDAWFPLSDESDGTKRLFSIAAPILSALDSGARLVVDEMNNSLHPLLIQKIVELFHDPSVNRNGAQLIFTCDAFFFVNPIRYVGVSDTKF